MEEESRMMVFSKKQSEKIGENINKNLLLKVAKRDKKMQLKLIQKYYNLTHKKFYEKRTIKLL